MDRVGTGIEGLDDMLGGGLPRGHVVAVMGSFGTGKTTFGLQFLQQGLKDGEKGIFISLEEDQESILANALSYGWDLRRYIDERRLAVLKLEPTDAKNSIGRIRSELPELLRSFGATRIVLDSVSLLNMLYDSDHEKRINLFNLIQMFKGIGATCLMTAEVQDSNPNASRDGLIEYAVDGVIGLRYEEHPEVGEIKLTVRVMKMRRIEHSRRVKPYSITSHGIEVHSAADAF
ncbi:MAG TPA: KaiC domain-containing protein [Methanomassiliicoccaceae archaeon]|jgi:KaiC domain protein|nr:KaiC domain-containing protein [Euryarchaeota archaeon]HOB37842.1 KaiC domain-containing protein [Methanomassiliicoccaceae archaeon]HOK28450.1 KaiC domain-containing protein [Methanomassiliicoccaceae archaeon]HOL06846.1 KaiC domain-containing protein [Methanomassiliicoccaceae archaeon]HOQ26596.1 KaiC domain-containing protein [Methanomassiliicoccaceae archaeon]